MKKILLFAFLLSVGPVWGDDASMPVPTPSTGDSQSLFDKAQKLFQEKNYKEAKRALTELVAQHPGDNFVPKARLLIAKLQDDFDVSVSQFRELAEDYEGSPAGEEAQKDLGARYYLSDKYDDAADSYREFIDKYSKSQDLPEAHYWLASCYLAMDQDQKAADEYKKVVEKSKDSPWAPKALLGMGAAYFKMKKYGDAEKQYLKIMDQYHQYEELNLVYLKLGETYELEKKPKQAYAAYQTLLDHYPKALEVTEAKERVAELEKAHPELNPHPAAQNPAPTPTLAALQATPTEAVMKAAPTPTTGETDEQADQTNLKPTPFHVQVGVYSKKSNVVKAQKAVKKAGYDSYVITVTKDDEAYTYYKVRVGNYSDRETALNAAKIIARKTKEKAIVVEE